MCYDRIMFRSFRIRFRIWNCNTVWNSWQITKFVIDLIPELAVRFLIAYNCTRWCGTFKVLSQDEGVADFSKNLRTSSLTKTFRINQIFAGFISLDITFKDPNQDPESGSCKRLTRIRIDPDWFTPWIRIPRDAKCWLYSVYGKQCRPEKHIHNLFYFPNKTRYTYLHGIFAASASNFFTFVSAACKTAFSPENGAG